MNHNIDFSELMRKFNLEQSVLGYSSPDGAFEILIDNSGKYGALFTNTSLKLYADLLNEFDLSTLWFRNLSGSVYKVDLNLIKNFKFLEIIDFELLGGYLVSLDKKRLCEFFNLERVRVCDSTLNFLNFDRLPNLKTVIANLKFSHNMPWRCNSSIQSLALGECAIDGIDFIKIQKLKELFLEKCNFICSFKEEMTIESLILNRCKNINKANISSLSKSLKNLCITGSTPNEIQNNLPKLQSLESLALSNTIDISIIDEMPSLKYILIKKADQYYINSIKERYPQIQFVAPLIFHAHL